MAPLVRLRLGNQFDDQSDLIALPCDTNGKVTASVEEKLRRYSMPAPKGPFAHGKVVYLPYQGKEHRARFVAFAASVSGTSPTTHDVIGTIGNSLGEFTNRNRSVLRVSVPLFGTGAGQLPAVIAYKALSESFRSSASPDAVLTISVLRRDELESLQSAFVIDKGPKGSTDAIRPEDAMISPSVETAIGRLPSGEEISSAQLAREIFKLHPEYAGGRGASISLQDTISRKTAESWIKEVKTLFDLSASRKQPEGSSSFAGEVPKK